MEEYEVVSKQGGVWTWKNKAGDTITLPAGRIPTPEILWSPKDFAFLDAPQTFVKRLIASLHQRSVFRNQATWPKDVTAIVAKAVAEAVNADATMLVNKLRGGK